MQLINQGRLLQLEADPLCANEIRNIWEYFAPDDHGECATDRIIQELQRHGLELQSGEEWGHISRWLHKQFGDEVDWYEFGTQHKAILTGGFALDLRKWRKQKQRAQAASSTNGAADP